MSIKTIWTIIILLSFSNTNISPCYHPIYFEQGLSSYQMTLMIDPAGDAQHVGRKIDDCFERGITLQYTEQLKKGLEEEYPGIRIILTHLPGEIVQPLQNANFANRLNVNLFLSIHFYHESLPKPNLYIYYFSYGNNLCNRTFDLCFYPYEQAYLFSKEKTAAWAQQIKEGLSQEAFCSLFDIKGPYGPPFKPLIGIKCPAIAIEAGLKQANDWQQYIKPLIASLGPIIMNYQQHVEES